MNTILSFMDKLYSDSKTLSIVYIIGSVLLFIFIIMLIISLRKPKEETNIIDEPKIDDENKVDEEKTEDKVIEKEEETEITEEKEELKELSEQSIFEKTVIIPLDELNKQENLEKALDVVEEKSFKKEVEKEEEKVDIQNISSEIPDVDSFVDNVVKKTYEKNEQFSSVFVGNETSTIKLDKVMENLNVDENVLENIVPEEEKTEIKDELEVKEVKETIVEEVKEPETNNKLDALKKALDDKKQEINLKQDDLKAKLESLKQNK